MVSTLNSRLLKRSLLTGLLQTTGLSPNSARQRRYVTSERPARSGKPLRRSYPLTAALRRAEASRRFPRACPSAGKTARPKFAGLKRQPPTLVLLRHWAALLAVLAHAFRPRGSRRLHGMRNRLMAIGGLAQIRAYRFSMTYRAVVRREVTMTVPVRKRVRKANRT
jgi:hypothetical protein